MKSAKLYFANQVTALLLLAIRCYQTVISPFLGQRCRYYPSCSSYTSIAITQHGIMKGCWLGIKRIARCHPGHPGGIDYPPGCESKTCDHTHTQQ